MVRSRTRQSATPRPRESYRDNHHDRKPQRISAHCRRARISGRNLVLHLRLHPLSPGVELRLGTTRPDVHRLCDRFLHLRTDGQYLLRPGGVFHPDGSRICLPRQERHAAGGLRQLAKSARGAITDRRRSTIPEAWRPEVSGHNTIVNTDTGTRTHAGYQPNVVFDIGLHRGEDTSFYLQKGYKVIAFEADPDLVQHCKNRFKNQISTQQLQIVEGAITSEIGGDPIRFYKNAKLSVWGTLHQDWNERNESVGAGGTVIEVARVDMGLCIEKFGIPHFMKIDIEGADTVALSALREFSQRPAYI